MAKALQADRVKLWQERVNAANRAYTMWAEEYRCKECENFYNGHQWPDETKLADEDKYTVNLVFSTVETFVPSLFFARPMVQVKPRPGRSDDVGSMSADRAKLQQDTVNTMLSNREIQFQSEGELALKESFWRFGVLEIGYTADFIDNPNAGKPILKEEGDTAEDAGERAPLLDVDGNPVLEPLYKIQAESLFVKRIPAEQWRVSARNKPNIYHCDWCGYYEYHHPEDLRRNKRYKNTTTLNPTTYVRREYSETDLADDDEEREKKRGMIKVWKIWDIRTRRRYVFPEGGEKFFVDGEHFDYLPFEDLRLHKRNTSWYPIPPIYNWLSSQRELNDSREMMRVHRQRFVRRYRVDPGVDNKEAEKLSSPVDGTVIRAKEGQITPIQDAELGASVQYSIPASREDLREISGMGGEQRGIANADTATQAGIIEARGQVRESYYRAQVAAWLGGVAYLALRMIRDLMVLPFWVKVSVDPFAPGAPAETARVTEVWQQIQSEQLGELNLDISVDVSTLSPVAQEQEKSGFFQGLAIISTPQFAPLLLGSDFLLRKALSYFGITAEREVQEIKKAVLLAMMQQMQAAQAKAGGPEGVIPQNAPGGGMGMNAAQAGPTDNVPKQITNQLVGNLTSKNLV